MKLPNKNLNYDKNINLYAYISSIPGFDIKEQDYEPHELCITLTIINEKTFENQDFNNENGCDTMILSIAAHPYLCDIDPDTVHFNMENSWIKITGEICNKLESNAYFYQAFSELDSTPRYININKIELIKNEAPSPLPPITSLSDLKSSIKNEEGKKVEFFSFHVGQGMCSLMTIGSTGIIFDMGAGKPIQRQTYSSKKNE
ncbi:TPA: hypothetical protein OUG05_002641, partial [Morganella morganii]|nr:hypothetical protein [Morganella morganii]